MVITSCVAHDTPRCLLVFFLGALDFKTERNARPEALSLEPSCGGTHSTTVSDMATCQTQRLP